MGAEREDTDPSALKGGTEPGLGPKRPPETPRSAPPRTSHATTQAHATSMAGPPPDEGPAPVDFDALHAALGDLPTPTSSGSIPPKAPVDERADSDGRTSATYASSRPHTIPPTLVPSDLDAPPVIVATDDTVPSAPPSNMTTPIHGRVPSGSHPIDRGPSSNREEIATAQDISSLPFSPSPFPAQRGIAQPTMRMPERPRRPRSPTVVVRPRGPSKVQKLIVFMAMLLLFLAFATAVAIWRQPGWFGIESAPPPPTAPVLHPAPPPPTATMTAAATTTTTTTATAPSSSAKGVPTAKKK